MLNRGDDDDDVDDDMRTTVPSQKCATTILSTEESFLRTQYLLFSPYISSDVRGGGGRTYIESQLDNYRQSQLDA